VAKKKVAAMSVSFKEAFPMIGLALQLEVPMAAASIPSLKVGEECWNSGLDARLEAVAPVSSWRWRWRPHRNLPGYGRPSPWATASHVLDPYENPVT
jgi:hypothetical protein